VYRVFVWKSDLENDLEDPGLDGRIILQGIFRRWNGRHGLEWSDSEQGQVASSCKRGTEPSVSIKCREFLD